MRSAFNANESFSYNRQSDMGLLTTINSTISNATLTQASIPESTSSVTYAVLENNFYAISVLNSISNAVALFIDVIALIGIVKAKNFNMGTRVFLANLTIIDLISAATLQPCTTAYLISWINGSSLNSIKIWTDVTNSLHYILTLASFFAFMTVSLDRYMLIYHQFLYSERMTTKIAIVMSCIGNVSAVVSYVILKFTTKAIFIYFSIIMYVSIVFLLFIHTRIMITARRTYQKIRRSAYVDQVHQKRLKRRHVEIKQASVTLGLFVTIIICYLPIIIVNQIGQSHRADPLQLAIINHWALFLMMACPIAKQLLLCLLNTAIRAAIRRWIFSLRDPVFV